MTYRFSGFALWEGHAPLIARGGEINSPAPAALPKDKIRKGKYIYMAKIFKHRTDVAFFDYKDFKTLQRYVNQYGQIETRKKTGLSESQQRRLSVAIKRARHIALLPFVVNG